MPVVCAGKDWFNLKSKLNFCEKFNAAENRWVGLDSTLADNGKEGRGWAWSERVWAFDPVIGLFAVGGRYNSAKTVERSLDYGVTFELLADHPTGMTQASLVIVDNDTLFLSFGASEYFSLFIDDSHETYPFALF